MMSMQEWPKSFVIIQNLLSGSQYKSSHSHISRRHLQSPSFHIAPDAPRQNMSCSVFAPIYRRLLFLMCLGWHSVWVVLLQLAGNHVTIAGKPLTPSVCHAPTHTNAPGSSGHVEFWGIAPFVLPVVVVALPRVPFDAVTRCLVAIRMYCTSCLC